MMGISIGIVGVGVFARHFIPLVKAHPLVDDVVLCDPDPEQLRAGSGEFDIAKTYPSLDALCDSSVDAVALFAQ